MTLNGFFFLANQMANVKYAMYPMITNERFTTVVALIRYFFHLSRQDIGELLTKGSQSMVMSMSLFHIVVITLPD